jgi:hypothetical protein
VTVIAPKIFWLTLFFGGAGITFATILGRVISLLLPLELREEAINYLSPIMGIAALTACSSLVGRYLPLGSSAAVIVFLPILFAFATVVCRGELRQATKQAASVLLLAIVCGSSVLIPLFLYGAFNSHTDAFTYLSHSQWLQYHAFNTPISLAELTPTSSQVILYQEHGYRMGGSFLLALFQGLSQARWAFQIYPAVVIAILAASSLATGYVSAKWLNSLRSPERFFVLTLPFVLLGGLVSGATAGFLPQTLGLSLSVALFGLFVRILIWAAEVRPGGRRELPAATLPVSTLFCAALFAYSEFFPFVLMTLGVTGATIARVKRAFLTTFAVGVLIFVTSLVTLNTEILRIVEAVLSQAGAVAGGPIIWPLGGFIAHALGLHGGIWDPGQWTLHIGWSEKRSNFAAAIVILPATAFLIFALSKSNKDAMKLLLPFVVASCFIAFAFIYFRYFMQSPFPVGVGQSWSQAKLVDWIFPFVSVLFVASISSLLCENPNQRRFAFFTAVYLLTACSVFFSYDRIQPLMNHYPGVKDLDGFYRDFRVTVLKACPPEVPIYLALEGPNHNKLRQMISLYLDDRVLKSNWRSDGYFVDELNRPGEKLASGDCVVEPVENTSLVDVPILFGAYRIGLVSLNSSGM